MEDLREPGWIGYRGGSLGAEKKVRGETKFLTDVGIPGCYWAHVVRSPHALARIVDIDVGGALELPGVVDVYTALDVPASKFNSAAAPPSPALSEGSDKSLLTETPQHVGDGIAVVLAESRSSAARGAEAVNVSWEVEEPILDVEEALSRGNILGTFSMGDPSVEKAVNKADVVVTGSYHTPSVQHICLEPHACAAMLDPLDGRLTIWSNTQAPSDIRRLCGDILGLSVGDIRVRKVNEGGGFGGKQELYEEALVGWLALKTERPVRLSFEREEEFTCGRGRHGCRIEVRLGLSLDGRIEACDTKAVLDSGAYISHAPYVVGDLGSALAHTYPQAAYRFVGRIVKTNTLTGGAYRGYGAPQGIFALERTVDKAADEVGLDPIDIRLRNCPERACEDRIFGDLGAGRLGKCLSMLQTVVEPRTDTSRVGGQLMYGSGIAACAMVNVTSPRIHESTTATVRWNEDGTVTLVTGTCDSGTGSSTALAQIVAEELSLSLEAVRVREGDTDSGLVDLGSFGQRSLFIGGGAARAAAIRARESLVEAVNYREEPKRRALQVWDGFVVDANDPGFRMEIGSFCREVAGQGALLGTATYRPSANPPTFGACAVEVSVDPATCCVRVERCVLAVDAGAVVNQLEAEGQIRGAAVQGLGAALTDAWVPNEEGGGPKSILEHGAPSAADVPEIEVVFTHRPEPVGPYGAKGLGEVGIVPVAAAVANGVSQATEKSFDRLPVSPAEVWALLYNGSG